MKKLILSLSVLATVALFSACTKSNNNTLATASVMFVNGTAGTSGSPESAKANGTSISGASSIAFQGASGYQNVTAGTTVDISLVLASSGVPLGSDSILFTAGNSYSIFSGGEITSPTFVYTNDDLSAPASGDAKIRLVNLSPDSLSLTGTLTNTSAATTSTFGSGIGRISTSTSVSAFTSVAAGTYKLVVADPSNFSLSVFSNSSQQINAGKIYTVIYTGTAVGSGTSAYTATVISNN